MSRAGNHNEWYTGVQRYWFDRVLEINAFTTPTKDAESQIRDVRRAVHTDVVASDANAERVAKLPKSLHAVYEKDGPGQVNAHCDVLKDLFVDPDARLVFTLLRFASDFGDKLDDGTTNPVQKLEAAKGLYLFLVDATDQLLRRIEEREKQASGDEAVNEKKALQILRKWQAMLPPAIDPARLLSNGKAVESDLRGALTKATECVGCGQKFGPETALMPPVLTSCRCTHRWHLQCLGKACHEKRSSQRLSMSVSNLLFRCPLTDCRGEFGATPPNYFGLRVDTNVASQKDVTVQLDGLMFAVESEEKDLTARKLELAKLRGDVHKWTEQAARAKREAENAVEDAKGKSKVVVELTEKVKMLQEQLRDLAGKRRKEVDEQSPAKKMRINLRE